MCIHVNDCRSSSRQHLTHAASLDTKDPVRQYDHITLLSSNTAGLVQASSLASQHVLAGQAVKWLLY